MKQEKYKAKLNDIVQFCYRKNSSIVLTGYVVSVLENTVIVDIANIQHSFNKDIDIRQVVRHGKYTRVSNEKLELGEPLCTFSM
ncbi:DUF2187 family protein [Bacillus pseudomycoides]|uniref:DUF2187 family protein n=1 Tax=Bacillus pseudomycoides TaxID=64104 RepID=UPI000508D3DB|nr:DUF2187 family protein [Bacillus pseudomycoides]KFN11945.1 hypothetical protein DJ94_5315 [Bacillus pseudomycoides]MDR4188092.1 DUF2187 domain-containing protein [Bacillus pseudomycoides]MED0855817.1 DUF2187 family protein [Bacillus pseudomycoides]PFW93912.1 DUF2187 domain-containing protein [Bacillus pseudomycoides]PGA76481.1 DUF2187 domain-containing protein [Bacillus pseudomycoides]